VLRPAVRGGKEVDIFPASMKPRGLQAVAKGAARKTLFLISPLKYLFISKKMPIL
jgi:hypothetical protein